MDNEANQQEIARLAYQLWEDRGRPFGSAEVDWFHAQAIFAQRGEDDLDLSFSSLAMEPVES